jgi:hypothetical protein
MSINEEGLSEGPALQRSAYVSIEELALWRESNAALTAATQQLADRLEVVASRQEIDAAMDKRMALVEREAAEALELNTSTAREARTRAWWLIVLSLVFSVLVSMQLRDVVAYQCYPRLDSGRAANETLCDAAFPFSPHDFGNQTGVSNARIVGWTVYGGIALGIVGVATVYRRRFRTELSGSDRLLRRSQEREKDAVRNADTAERDRDDERRRREQRRRRKDDPPPTMD